MPTRRLPMRKLREILRLKCEAGLSNRAASRSLQISSSAVSKVMTRARRTGLTWEAAQTLSDEELELKLFGPKQRPGARRPLPDPVKMHTELKKKGVTLELLHLEYLEQHPDGYRYSAFCDFYRRWRRNQRLSLRQDHKAGEKLFVDYSGARPKLVDRKTGEIADAELFVAVLGASNYTYAEASLTQRTRDFIESHVRALEYLGGVPELIISDQLRSGVTVPCRYEPGIQRTYRELSTHYGTVALPARPGKPKDKAKVEAGVQVSQRWILARLRHETFFSLTELNRRIGELLEELNSRPMKVYGGKTRRELFLELDRPVLKPLPPKRFVWGDWKLAKVSIDYHVQLHNHYYSVPYALRGEEVEIRHSINTVEVFCRGKRVASHRRSNRPGRHTTNPEHMPKSHREHSEWSPSRLIRWASGIGSETGRLVVQILNGRDHPEQGYRSCLGILRLGKRYGEDRLEAACGRALRLKACSYRHVASMLKHNLDRLPPDELTQDHLFEPIDHQNVRGPEYYTEEISTDAK